MSVQLGRWYVSAKGKVIITEEFIGANGVRVCTDDSTTEILGRKELDTEWRMVDEKDPNIIDPVISPPAADFYC